MWDKAMKRNLFGPIIVNENHPVMAELQRERECNLLRPGAR
jgi:hypothetical protein